MDGCFKSELFTTDTKICIWIFDEKDSEWIPAMSEKAGGWNLKSFKISKGWIDVYWRICFWMIGFWKGFG